MDLRPGSRLGVYEVLARLGAGGMGEVWRARDTRLGREVAIKVLPPEVSTDADRLRRFEKEAQAASSLNHPNIVTIYEVEEVDSTSFIVMELVAGKTLREVLSEGPLTVRKLLGIAVQIADGLARAHSAGIVHRDLKPENVMVTRDGLVKILDFGLAKLARPDREGGQATEAATVSEGTTPGIVMGTVGYMSPEQASGYPLDFRSDQFSFGSLLYEMATGKGPFRRATAAQTLAAIIQDEPEPVAAANPSMPAPLRWIIEQCLAKEAKDRYASTEDLARDLSRIRDHLSEASASGEILAEPHRRPRFAMAYALATLVLLGAAVASYRVGAARAEHSPATYRRLTYRRGWVGAARFSPDGQTVVYSAAWDGKPPEIFSTRAESPEGRPLGISGAEVSSISKSGEMALAFIRPDGGTRLARAALGGGAARDVLDDVEVADWSADGQSLAIVRQGAAEQLEWPAGRVLYKSQGWISNVRVSSRGDVVAFLDHPTWGPGGSVSIVDRAGRKRTLASSAAVFGLAWSPRRDELWFSAHDGSTPYALHAVTLSGNERVITRAPIALGLHDISADGRVLLARTIATVEAFGRAPDETKERDLSWLDRSLVYGLSSDGRMVLYSKVGEGSNTVYVRKTDGSPAVRLGEGGAYALSSDGKWVLTTQGSPRQIVLLPTGMGEAVRLPRGQVDLAGLGWFWWFPDGQRVLFNGSEQGHRPRCYAQAVTGGLPTPLTPEGTRCRLPSPDGRVVVTTEGALYSLEGGQVRTVPGLSKGDWPLQWSADGRWLYVRRFEGLPTKVYRVDLQTGRRELWKEFLPADPSGVTGIDSIYLTPDGTSYVYCYQRTLSDLYLAEGLR